MIIMIITMIMIMMIFTKKVDNDNGGRVAGLIMMIMMIFTKSDVKDDADEVDNDNGGRVAGLIMMIMTMRLIMIMIIIKKCRRG